MANDSAYVLKNLKIIYQFANKIIEETYIKAFTLNNINK